MTSLALQASPLLRLEVMDGVCWCCCLSVWLSLRLSSLVAAPATCPGHLFCWSELTGLFPFLLVLAADGRWTEASSSQWKTGVWAGREGTVQAGGHHASSLAVSGLVESEGFKWGGGWVPQPNLKPAHCLRTAAIESHGLVRDKRKKKNTVQLFMSKTSFPLPHLWLPSLASTWWSFIARIHKTSQYVMLLYNSPL